MDRNLIKFKNKYMESIFIIFILLSLSILLVTITFMFSSAVLNLTLFKSYFASIPLIIMNIIPIIFLLTILYLIVNRIWLSFALTSFLFITMSIINKFKLFYRDDPFSFVDIRLVKESMEMVEKYKITLSPNMIILILGIVVIIVMLKMFFNYKLDSKRNRVIMLIFFTLINILFFKFKYFDSKIYRELGDKSLINIWSESQQFQSKGFIYPFIYSVKSAEDIKLEDYNEKQAIKDLDKYEYHNIPEEQKVNIIGIMLEAYNDFSKFDGVELGIDVYENFHKIQEESVHGGLVTNVFGGDTIKTERSFLTGYKSHPKYFKNTNSFVWYLKEQGYRTEAMHPIYGWFYNRRNINSYIGFDSFDYYENKYKEIQEVFMDDIDFFDYIIEGYENSRDKSIPYFNFSVTYQNHGPYSNEKYFNDEYLKKKSNYDEETYNIINNYLAGINKTDKALKELVDYFRNEDEPTVIILFGDHNPWLGKDAVGYGMMDIDIDFSTSEGFLNYYETPYIIWGNESAKKAVNKEFKMKGNDVSPNFLMAELFQYLGWEGNEYMGYISDFKNIIDVNHNVYFKEDGEYTTELSPDNENRNKDFMNVEYYYSHNFNKKH